MKYKAIARSVKNSDAPRDSIASGAWVRHDMEAPKCITCGAAQQLFLQFDIDEKFGLSFEGGSHVVLFMCPDCNEIPSFDSYENGKLPDQFWSKTEGHFFVANFKAKTSTKFMQLDSLLRSYALEFEDDSAKSKLEEIRIGGEPNWLQTPENFTCQCGAEMKFIAQISENYRFPKLASAPPQPDSFSEDDYCLFLGNEVYIFGCVEHCDDRAVWIAVQN